MARTKEPKNTDPFVPKVAFAIKLVISQMRDKQLELSKEPFTPEDLLELFVAEEDWATLRRAWDLVEPAGTTQELYVATTSILVQKEVYFRFRWHHHNVPKGFYVPFAAGGSVARPARLRPEAPAALRDRFTGMARDMIEVALRFANVKKVFDALNKQEACRWPGAMRYVWPCIYPLANKAGWDKAQTLQEAHVRYSETRVPLDVINLIGQTNETVVRAILLDDVKPDLKRSPVPYDLYSNFEPT